MPLEGPVLEAPGGSLFGISGVLAVGSSRCLHSHAESLRVTVWGQRRAAGSSELGGTGWREELLVRGGTAVSLPWRKEGGFGAPSPRPPDSLPSFPPGEMYKLYQEIPLYSGLPAGGEAGHSTIPSLLRLLSLPPRCPNPGSSCACPGVGDWNGVGRSTSLAEARRFGPRSAQSRPHSDLYPMALWLRPGACLFCPHRVYLSQSLSATSAVLFICLTH